MKIWFSEWLEKNDVEVSCIRTVTNKAVTTRSSKGKQEWIGRLDLQET